MFQQFHSNSRTHPIFNVLIGVLFLIHTATAQPQIEWIYNYGATDGEIGEAIIQSNDGGYLVVGAQRVDITDEDWWIIKLNAQGDIEWQKNLGTTLFERANDVKPTSDNGYVIIGTFSDDGTVSGHNGLDDFTIIKLDAQGTVEWQKLYGGNLSEQAHAMTLTADGGYVIAGNSNGLGSATQSDGLFMKLDSVGNLEWEKQYGGSLSDEIFSIQQTDDLGFVAVGCSNSTDGDIVGINNGGNDIWILKMDAAGDLEWSEIYGGSNQEASRSVQQADDGGYVVAGYTQSVDGDITNHYGNQDIWLLKLNATGKLEWEKNFGGQNQDRVQAIQKVSTGGYVVAGWSRSNDEDVAENKGLSDIWIFKIDNDGNLEWEKNFGGSTIDQCFDIKETSDGGLVATGNTNSINGDFNQNFGNFDLWVMKLSPLAVGLSQNNEEQKINIFPNPNSGQFSINACNIKNPVDIKIWDLNGKNVYSKLDADLNQPIAVGAISKGLYLLEVTIGQKSYFEKILID